jgi:hypothetical protein
MAGCAGYKNSQDREPNRPALAYSGSADRERGAGALIGFRAVALLQIPQLHLSFIIEPFALSLKHVVQCSIFKRLIDLFLRHHWHGSSPVGVGKHDVKRLSVCWFALSQLCNGQIAAGAFGGRSVNCFT